MSDRTPNYLSVASADLILSEIRPTKIKPEALLAVNIIVDEMLWLILNAARSLATERLNRDGLMKILPTGLGKDALLEAEVELKAYWDRTDPVDRGCTIEHNSKLSEFPLQSAFELMRAKCEVYSTLGDAEEDIEEEDRLQNQMMLASPGPPRASAVAPAALYITAMLEHICEHILTNVAKVVARDSSRTTAHVSDVYVALCEDESIYPLFKRMKVKEQLEAQAKAASKPRRSRSVNTHQQNGRGSPSSTLRGSTSSPQPRPSDAVSVGTNKVARTSEESSGTSGPPATSPPRKSGEKSRLKMFGRGGAGSNSTDQEVYYSSRHQRSDSSMSDTTRRTAAGFSDSADEYHHDPRSDFEDLMRSGTTMKVSLTPDRLRSFEVFAKEKSQRNGRSSSVSSVNPPPPAAPDLIVPMPASAPSVQPSFKLANKGSRSNLVARPPQTVESIEEDEDEEGYGGSTSASGGNGRGPPGVNKPRSRTQSLAQFLQEAPPWEKDAPLESVAMGGGSGAMSVPNTAVPKIVTGRARSQTTGSGGPSPSSTTPSTAIGPTTPSSGAAPNVKKKTSGYLTPVGGSAPPSAFRAVPKVGPVPEGSRRGPAKNIEDIDLDDLLADDDDEASSINTAAASINTNGQPKKGALGGRKNSLTGSTAVSASTREMIDFLSEGPPPSPPASSPKTPIKEVQPTKPKGSGRFGRMISKLARSSSTEAMSFDKRRGSSAEDVSRQTPSMGSHSHKSSTAAPLPQWTRPTPPPPPPVIPAAQPAPVAPSPTTPTQSSNPPAVVRARAGSSARKPAPPFPTTTPSPLATAASIEPSPQPSVSPSPAITPTRSRLSSMRSRPSTAPSSAVVPVTESPAPVPVEDETPAQPEGQTNPMPQAPALAPTPPITSTPSSASEQPARSLSDKSVGTDEIEVEPIVPAPIEEVAAPPPAPEVPAGSVFVDAERAQLMRQMVARATSVEECRILVEMFLAQWGVPRTAEEQDEPETEETDKELKAEEEAHGPPLVEALLGDNAACEANADDNQTDDAHDVPRTPKTPTDVLHSEEPSTTSTAAEPYSADIYQKNLDSDMLPPSSHPIIAA